MTMRLVALAGPVLLMVTALAAQSQKAAGSVSLTDPAGDVNPIETSNNRTFPGFDVVKLDVVSDGKEISFAATLKDPPGDFATDVLELYFDTDNLVKTGIVLINPPVGGFEFKGDLRACATYSDSSRTCAGGAMTAAAKVSTRYASAFLFRYKGPTDVDGRIILVDSNAFPPATEAPQVPIKGTLVQASLLYTSLGVKPGQTIRLVVRESCTYPTRTGMMQGFFPEILLTLK